jgi:hypothetical protein
MVNFNLKKSIIFPIFRGHKNTQVNNLSYFGNLQILGCYTNPEVNFCLGACLLGKNENIVATLDPNTHIA